MSKEYGVYAQHMILSMNGDRAEDNEKGGPEWIYIGPSLDEARKAYEDALEGGGYAPKVIDQRHGIGAIEHWAITLDCTDQDEDGYDETKDIDGDDGITDELRTAWWKAKRSYYGWLDYDDDGYLTVSDCLDNMHFAAECAARRQEA